VVCSTPFGCPGRTGGVEDEQRIFRVHFNRCAMVGHPVRFVVVPDVPTFGHGNVTAGPLDDNHAVDGCLFDGLVDIGFQRNLAAAAQAFVGGDDAFAVTAFDALGERIRRKAAEHDGMDSADPGAGQHGVGRFRDHRQVQGNAVALLDALGMQHIGEYIHLVVQFLVGDDLAFGRVVAFPDDRRLVAARRQMPVDTVRGHVKRTVLKPLDVDVVVIVGGVLHLGEGLDPVDALAVLAPEPVRVLDGLLVHFQIFGIVHVRMRRDLGRHGEYIVRHVNTSQRNRWYFRRRKPWSNRPYRSGQ
jgi:hypothetical protein